MKNRGRPISGAISGLIFGLSIGLELVFFKVMTMGSMTTMWLPLGGAVLGLLLGLMAPFKKTKPAAAAQHPSNQEAPPPEPVAPDAPAAPEA